MMIQKQNPLKVLAGTPKHLSATGKLNQFTYLMLNLPFKCNYRCQKCFNLDGGTPKKYANQLPLGETLALIDQAKEAGVKTVVFAGEGEPLLDKNIFMLMSKVHASQLTPIIYTNGSTLNNETIKFLKGNGASVVVSFDAIKKSLYGYLTGRMGTFDKVAENIQNLIGEFRETIEIADSLRILRVAVNTTVSSENIMAPKRIKDYFGDDVYFICNPLSYSGNAVSNWEKGWIEDIRKLLAKIVLRTSESGGPLTAQNDGFCGYSRWGIAVNPEGEYMTCAYTDKTSGLLGNVKKIGLSEAFERKQELETSHYGSLDYVPPCLIRDSSFEEYIKRLGK